MINSDAIGIKIDMESFSYIDTKVDSPMGIICSDNSNSIYNHFTREDNSFVATCLTTGLDNELSFSENKFVRVNKEYMFNRLNVLLIVLMN